MDPLKLKGDFPELYDYYKENVFFGEFAPGFSSKFHGLSTAAKLDLAKQKKAANIGDILSVLQLGYDGSGMINMRSDALAYALYESDPMGMGADILMMKNYYSLINKMSGNNIQGLDFVFGTAAVHKNSFPSMKLGVIRNVLTEMFIDSSIPNHEKAYLFGEFIDSPDKFVNFMSALSKKENTFIFEEYFRTKITGSQKALLDTYYLASNYNKVKILTPNVDEDTRKKLALACSFGQYLDNCSDVVNRYKNYGTFGDGAVTEYTNSVLFAERQLNWALSSSKSPEQLVSKVDKVGTAQGSVDFTLGKISEIMKLMANPFNN